LQKCQNYYIRETKKCQNYYERSAKITIYEVIKSAKITIHVTIKSAKITIYERYKKCQNYYIRDIEKCQNYYNILIIGKANQSVKILIRSSLRFLLRKDFWARKLQLILKRGYCLWSWCI